MALTFSRLGHVGRLGNQLWQIASTIGIGAKRGEPVFFPEWDYRPFFSVPEHYFIPKTGGMTESPTTAEVKHIDPRAREYLQDLALWSDTADQIRKIFIPSEDALETITRTPVWDVLETAPKTVSIHVRRGDNLRELTSHRGFHPLKGPDFYEQTIQMVPEDAIRIVFSDDPEWCKRELPFVLGGECVFVAGHPRPDDPRKYWRAKPLDWIDLQLMTFCQHHVISNSTFAWWGAWLSDDPSPIYPTPWFGEQLSHINADLMFPPEWRAVQYRTDYRA